MGLLAIALEAATGLLKLLRALIELEISKRRREECLTEARRARHLRK